MKNQENIQNKIKTAISEAVNSVLENSTGTAIRPNTIIPSEKRAELSSLYSILQSEYGDLFNIQFNQTNILINAKCSNDPRVNIYETEEKEVDQPEFDWAGNAAAMIGFFQKEGLNLDPLPEIILKKEPQTNGLLDPTGNYDPDNNIIQVYTYGRHPKDCLATLSHELQHVDQNNRGKINNITTDRVSDSDDLEKLEAEAYMKGRLLFRKWTESMKKN